MCDGHGSLPKNVGHPGGLSLEVHKPIHGARECFETKISQVSICLENVLKGLKDVSRSFGRFREVSRML